MPSLTGSVADLPPPDRDRRNSRVPLAMTFDALLGDDNAPDETADELIQAVRQGRNVPSGQASAV